MGWPQWIVISLWSLNLLLSFFQAGKTNKAEPIYNSLGNIIIFGGLIWWGGFFK